MLCYAKRMDYRYILGLISTNIAPAGLACLWPVETEWKLLVKRIQICLQYLLFWAIIKLRCKDFAIVVSFLIDSLNSSSIY